jgi:DNA-binding NarL/FixJ family response regulator
MPNSDESEPPLNSLVVPARGTPLRALIVEDDPLVARSLARWLRQRNVNVSVALRPSDVPALGTGFDFGIFDIDLPETNGAELAKVCLAQGVVGRVVFFSGSKDPSLREMAATLGEFVEKGEGMATLAERVLSAYNPNPVARNLLAVG